MIARHRGHVRNGTRSGSRQHQASGGIQETARAPVPEDRSTIPQDEAKATYTKKLSKEDGKINWSNSAIEINKKILAYTPWPGAFTYWNSKRIKIIEASLGDVEFIDDYSKGIVFQLDNNLHVMTGEGSLILNKIQLAGKKVILAKEFIQGYKDFMHAKLE